MKTKKVLKKKSSRLGIYLIGAAVVIAIVTVGILVALNAPRRAGAAGDVGSVVTLQPKDWPQAESAALGPADSPVVIREFSDFQCPFCRRFNEQVKDQIIAQFVETGKARFEYHHFIVIDGNVGGTESRDAAEASMCAAEQNRFWDYQETLFANQLGEGIGSFTDARLKAFAGQIGLNQADFDDCYNSRRYKNEVASDQGLGRKFGVNGTPSLFVNDQKIPNPFDLAAIQAAVDAALSQ